VIAPALLVPLRTRADLVDAVRQRYQRRIARIETVHLELREVADDEIGRRDAIAGRLRQRARNELHERGLAGAVAPENADAFAGIHGAAHALEHAPLALSG